MLFYKYYQPDPNSFAVVRNGEIFFAEADELNDSNELKPTFILRGSKELWRRFFEYALIHAAFLGGDNYEGSSARHKLVYGVARELSSAFYKRYWRRDVRLEDLYELVRGDVVAADFGDMKPAVIAANLKKFLQDEVPELVRPREFVASFSTSGVNTMMWGHYAKAGKGFSVVYESPDSLLRISSCSKIYYGARDKNGVLLPGRVPDGIVTLGLWADATIELKKVRYEPRDVKVNAFNSMIPHFFYSEEEDHYDVPLMIGAGAPRKGEDHVGLVKDEVWGFEDEVRAFLPLHTDRGEYAPPSMRIARVDLSHFRGLILGPNISEKDKINLIVSLKILVQSRYSSGDVRAKGHNIIVFQAIRGRNSFSYGVQPCFVIVGTGKMIELTRLKESEARSLSPDAWLLADQINQSHRRTGHS